MMDLNHWDFAVGFTAVQAALLIEGKSPELAGSDGRGVGDEDSVSKVILSRMSADYYLTRSNYFRQESISFGEFTGERLLLPLTSRLVSAEMNFYVESCFGSSDYVAFEKWRESPVSNFEKQIFLRSDIEFWIYHNHFKTKYNFGDLGNGELINITFSEESKSSRKELKTLLTIVDEEIDPVDLPYELDCAMQAFRAVTNGYGSADTFRNRLIDYLEKTFPTLKNDAVQRISTVANPDKSTGRKKRYKE